MLFLSLYRVCIYLAMKKQFTSVEQIYRQNAHLWRAPLYLLEDSFEDSEHWCPAMLARSKM
jgi:hypothetical protein